MHPSSLYLHEEVSPDQRPMLSDKWFFAGVDLAPNDTLETGLVAIDREKRMVRMDKINTDGQILHFLDGLGPSRNILVGLDVPKSLSIDSKWRQQEIKMHPLRLERSSGTTFTDRCSPRAWSLYTTLKKKGYGAFLFFSHLAKPRYDLLIPFRTRTPRGCRALQATIRNRLALKNMPENLAPSSVLDAMLGAYTAWTLYGGLYGQHYRLFWDRERRLMMEPLCRVTHTAATEPVSVPETDSCP